MAFRADESARVGYETAEQILISQCRGLDEAQKKRSKNKLSAIVDELGPVISRYPSWHPLVSNNDNHGSPVTTPGDDCGYKGLDHSVYFVNGFITCPYGDGQNVLDSVSKFSRHPDAVISAEKLDVHFYNEGTTPILIKCEWDDGFRSRGEEMTSGMIPLSTAMLLLLERELPSCRSAEVAETWETMRTYFLGFPCGSRSSLFVSQETGQGMKKAWEALIATRIFGPVRPRD